MAFSIAQVTTREGVVGAWQSIGTAPTALKPGASTADRWDAGPRLHLYSGELLTGLSFDASGGAVALEFRDRSENTRSNLVHLIRPSEANFLAQLDFVRGYAALRAERLAEITSQIGGGTGFLGGVVGMQPHRHRHTHEVLAIVSLVTQIIEMRLKHDLACRRPDEYSAQIQPMLQTPGHGSFPSGHATESFVAALVLEDIVRSGKAAGVAPPARSTSDPHFIQLMRIAERMAINRTVAGVHFPVDSAAGMVIARSLSEYYIARFAGIGNVYSRTFDGRDYADDFAYETIWQSSDDSCVPTTGGAAPKICRAVTPVAVPKSDLLNHLWNKAVAEWR